MTFEQFCQFIADFSHVPIRNISENSSFRDDLDIDSLQMVNLIVRITEQMEVGLDAISGQDDMSTVGKLYTALRKGADPR